MLKVKLCRNATRMLKAKLWKNTRQENAKSETVQNAETAETSNRKTLKWCRNIKQEPAETSAEMPHRKLLKQYINTKQENAQTVQKHQTGKCSNSAETPNRELLKQCRNTKQGTAKAVQKHQTEMHS